MLLPKAPAIISMACIYSKKAKGQPMLTITLNLPLLDSKHDKQLAHTQSLHAYYMLLSNIWLFQQVHINTLGSKAITVCHSVAHRRGQSSIRSQWQPLHLQL